MEVSVQVGGRPKIHDMCYTRIYKCWAHMKERCTNSKCKSYADYGGRGITYDVSWNKFVNFYADMSTGYEDYLTLDRIDVNGNYSKDNCKWSTRREQALNKRATKYITFNDKTQTITEWADELNISFDTLAMRLKAGWTLERALTSKKFVNQYK